MVFKLSDHGKVDVDEYLQAKPNVFVLGDNADTPYSGMAQTALYDAEFVATNIKRQLAGQSWKVYQPRQPITLIPVGPHWAAVGWRQRTFSGFSGWLLHIFVDLIAFHEIESWPKASQQWINSLSEVHDDCPHCVSNPA